MYYLYCQEGYCINVSERGVIWAFETRSMKYENSRSMKIPEEYSKGFPRYLNEYQDGYFKLMEGYTFWKKSERRL